MRKTKKLVAAVVAAVITATSSATMFTNADDSTTVAPAITSIGSDTQVESLRYMLNEYISKNKIEAWLYDKEDTPEGLIIIGYYFEDEDIPVKIVSYIKDKGYDPLLVNFVQEKHKQGEKIKNLDDISKLLSYYISENCIMANVIHNSRLLDDLSKDYTYVEYNSQKTDIPEILSKYMKENEIDTELVKIDVVGSFSKPYEPIKGYTFNDFRNLSTNEIESLFTENDMTKEKGYKVWTNNNTEIGIVNVLMQPNPFGDDKNKDLEVCWDDDKLKDIIAIPEDLFEIKQLSAMTIGENEDENEIKYVKTAQCSIIPKVNNTDEKTEILATALNYIQLNPYFVKFYYDYIGSNENIVDTNVKGDTNCDGQVDMADAVLIMQALANPNKYGINGTADNCLTEQGKINGDVDGNGLTVGDAQAIQKKLLGLDKDEKCSDIDETAIIGKTYLFYGNDHDGGFTITFNEDGKYAYYECITSSMVGLGTWEIKGDTIVLTDMPDSDKVNRFEIKENGIAFIEDNSDNFIFCKLKDGDEFSDMMIKNKVDWYSDFDKELADIEWNSSKKEDFAIVKDNGELKAYLETKYREKVVSKYLAEYDENYFKDNVLLMNTIYQGSGSEARYMVHTTVNPDGSLGVFLINNWKDSGDTMISVCLAQITIPKSAFINEGQTVECGRIGYYE